MDRIDENLQRIWARIRLLERGPEPEIERSPAAPLRILQPSPVPGFGRAAAAPVASTSVREASDRLETLEQPQVTASQSKEVTHEVIQPTEAESRTVSGAYRPDTPDAPLPDGLFRRLLRKLGL